MLSAIIIGGGSSRRMGFDKTFALLAGEPVLAHSIAAFHGCTSVEEIVIVGIADRLAEINGIVAERGFDKVRSVVAGGAHRQDSVAAGLRCTSETSSHVAVHDAARPLISPAEIESVFAAAQQHGAAALAAPINDTLKRATADGVVCGSVDREGVYGMQTPQIFSRELLERAYRKIAADRLTITDEVSAVEHLGSRVVLVPNAEYNSKITFPHDLQMAELILQQRRTRSRGLRV